MTKQQWNNSVISSVNPTAPVAYINDYYKLMSHYKIDIIIWGGSHTFNIMQFRPEEFFAKLTLVDFHFDEFLYSIVITRPMQL